jgi:hypothetical protein
MTHRIAMTTLVAATLAWPAWAGTYTYTTIDDPSADAGTIVWGISSNGILAGAYAANSVSHGFVDTGGSFTTIDAPGASLTQARGVNAAGTVVGDFYNGVGAVGYRGFIDIAGVFTTLNDPLAFSGATYAMGINNAGVVAGTYYDNAGSHGFVFANGVFTTVDVPMTSAGNTQVYGINDNGVISGTYYDNSGAHGFVDDGGIYTTVNDPLAAQNTYGQGLNNADALAGYYEVAGVGNASFVEAGNSFTSILDPLAKSGTTTANGVDDTGTVAGSYDDANDVSHGFIASMDSVPEPASLTLLGVGSTGVIVIRKRRRGRHDRSQGVPWI